MMFKVTVRHGEYYVEQMFKTRDDALCFAKGVHDMREGRATIKVKEIKQQRASPWRSIVEGTRPLDRCACSYCMATRALRNGVSSHDTEGNGIGD